MMTMWFRFAGSAMGYGGGSGIGFTVAISAWLVGGLASDGLAGVPPPFTEEAGQRGLNYFTTGGAFGRGVAFADLDDDGDPDLILLGRNDGQVGLFENDGTGLFVDRSTPSGIPLTPSGSAIATGDFDRDGDLDIYITAIGPFDRLLRNNGDWTFTDMAPLLGMTDEGENQGCAWADYDLDGWLDLYVANRSAIPNRLYHNNGDGTFTDMASVLGVDRTFDPTFQPVFFDFDRDGDPDLYLATDKGSNCKLFQNYLFENIGGTFVDITFATQTAGCVDAMCAAIGDFDNNGSADIYCTNTPQGNALMMNQGTGPFIHQETEAGVSSFAVGWGSVFFDFDNNGLLDLYVCNSSHPNRLYSNTGGWPCLDMASTLGVDIGAGSMTTATSDIDNDGDLDLLVHSVNDFIRLFINHEGENRNWGKFDVYGEGPNRYAIGANIDVRTGMTHQLREVIAGENFKSQNDLVQQVGLDTATVMDEIQIMWPGGTTRTLTHYAVNHTWKLYPPDKLGDYNGNGTINIDDLVFLLNHYTGPFTPNPQTPGIPGPLNPGAEMMDFDGDADLDVLDLIALLGVFG